ncbi:MAG: hypothetical protein EBU01_16550, partial [Crocinitomicaceae bacterium]|nr:hypothetical protein [Crocinitomicaceae bacterium]
MLEDMREDFPGINWCFVDITDLYFDNTIFGFDI